MVRSLQNACAFLCFSIFIVSCSGVKKLPEAPLSTDLSIKTQLSLMIDSSLAIRKSLYGIQFYDVEADSIIWEHNADKFFTPASNVKIFSFYTANKILGDSILAYKYDYSGDTLKILANGDPSFLHHYAQSSQAAFDRLKIHKGPIHLYLGAFEDGVFGSGWAWDDYAYGYQPEKSPFPIYGNTLRFIKSRGNDSISIIPKIFQNQVSFVSDSISKRFHREFGFNYWTLNAQKLRGRELDHEIPFKSMEALETLLKDTLGNEIKLTPGMPNPPLTFHQFSVSKQEMLKWMMEESDNFYAEQLMLMSSNALFDTMKVSMTINYAIDSIFTDIPDPIRWVDGSGLSRYNLFTPRSIVAVLKRFDFENTDDEIYYYFPRIEYIGDQQVYAKTGTLSNNRCLSGFLYTKSNKKILFSIMVNHHIESGWRVDQEIKSLIEILGNQY